MGPARDAAGGSSPRRYESPLRAKRADETRASLIAAATELFTTQGWTRTGMRQVASTAGVAVETLYSHFSSKRKLLDAVVDQAVVGDDAPIAVAERAEFAAIGTGSRTSRITAATALLTEVHRRTAPFAKLIREAATSDEEVAEVLRATRRRQRIDVQGALGLILGRAPTEEELDATWAIVSPEVFLLLVEESGWSLDRYERWMTDTLGRLLPRR